MNSVYFTIYYGFSKYEYVGKPPTITRYKVFRKTGIPVENIDVGVIGNIPVWKQPKKISKTSLFFGKLFLSAKNKVRKEISPKGKK